MTVSTFVSTKEDTLTRGEPKIPGAAIQCLLFGCPKAIDLLGQPCWGWTVRKAVGKFFGQLVRLGLEPATPSTEKQAGGFSPLPFTGYVIGPASTQLNWPDQSLGTESSWQGKQSARFSVLGVAGSSLGQTSRPVSCLNLSSTLLLLSPNTRLTCRFHVRTIYDNKKKMSSNNRGFVAPVNLRIQFYCTRC